MPSSTPVETDSLPKHPTANEIMTEMCLDMDMMSNVTAYAWRLRIHPTSYQILKEWDETERQSGAVELFYERDGEEFIRAFHNTTISFYLDYRVVLDETRRPDKDCGCRVEKDQGELLKILDDDEDEIEEDDKDDEYSEPSQS